MRIKGKIRITMKRLLTLVTLVTLLVGAVAGTALAGPASPGNAGGGHGKGPKMGAGPNAAVGRFKDLDEQPWAESSIAKMNARGIIKGYEDGTFGANKPVTRAEVAALAIRLINKEAEAQALGATFTAPGSTPGSTPGSAPGSSTGPAPNTASVLPFKDLAAIAAWERPYIAMAVKEGLMGGVMENGARVFQGHKPATRLEVAVILVRAMGLEALAKVNQAVLTFADKANIPVWAAGYIAVALEKGLVTGYPDKTFQPNKPVTRAEMAALLDRTDEKMDDSLAVSEVRGTVKSVAAAVAAVPATATSPAVDAAPASITLTVRGKDQTVNLVDNVVVYLNKQAAALTDLAAGDHAVVVKNADGLGVYVGASRDDASQTGDNGGTTPQTIAGLDVTFATDKDSYQLAAADSGTATAATFTLTMKNTTAQPVNLEFNNGQSFDFTVEKDGQAVWQWSHGQMFTQAVMQMTLAAGETKTYTAQWNLKNNDGQAVAAGSYSVKGWVTGHLQPGQSGQGGSQVPAIPAAPAAKTITVTAAPVMPPAPATIPGLTVTVATNKTSYVPTENVIMSITLANTTDAGIVIEAPTAQQYDFIVKKDGQKVWQWSDGGTFAQTVTALTILAHQTVSFSETWNQNNTAGQAAGVGNYTVEASVAGHVNGGTATPPVPAAAAFAVAQP